MRQERRMLTTGLAGLAALLFAGHAFSLGLGSIDVGSRLGQPFRAKIPLLASPSDLTDLSVELGNAADFRHAGVEMTGASSALKFEVKSQVAHPYVLVKGRQPVKEPFLSFVIKAHWNGGTLMRAYTVLLNPPGYQMAETGSPVAGQAQTSEAPSAERSGGSTATVGSGQMSVPTPVPQTNREPQPPVASATGPQNSESASSGSTSPATEKPVLAEPAHRAQRVRHYGPVKPGETFWSIATRFRPSPSVTMDQSLLAIYDANRSAFYRGRFDGLMKDQVLTIPDEAAMRSVSPAAAKSRVSALRAAVTARRVRVQAAAASKATRAAQAVEEPVTASANTEAPTGAATESRAEALPTMTAAGGAPTSSSPTGMAVVGESTAASGSASGGMAATPRPQAATSESSSTAVDASGANGEAVIAAPTITNSAVPAAMSSAAAALAVAAGAGTSSASPASGGSRETAASQQASAQPASSAATAVVAAGSASIHGAVPPSAASTTRVGGSAMVAGATMAGQSAAASTVSRPTAHPETRTQAVGARTGGGFSRWRLPAVVVLLIVIFGGLFLRGRRKRKDAETPVEDSATTQTRAGADDVTRVNAVTDDDVSDSVAGMTAEQALMAETSHDDVDDDIGTAGREDSGPAPSDADASDVADPLSEAQFHLDYGLHDEAIPLLQRASAREPDRKDIKLKLADAYLAAGKSAEFEEYARELKPQLSGSEWEALAAKGRELYPGAALFAAAGGAETLLHASSGLSDTDTAGFPDAGSVGSPSMQSASEFSHGVPGMDDGHGHSTPGDNVIEFDPTPATTAASDSDETKRNAAVDLGEFDLSEFDKLDPDPDPDPAERHGSDDATVIHGLGDTAESASLDLGEPHEVVPTHVAGTPPEAAVGDADDEFSTKLELAQAYVDLGDNDAARSLLDEVIQGGSEQQKRAAEAFSKTLSG